MRIGARGIKTQLESRRVRRLLLEHYDAHRRDLPWRGNREPYQVWVSEIMLQQTRVETVIPYYHHWMERFPTVEALADMDEESVLKAWEGLGYYSRARNLRQAALIVRDQLGGELPRDSQGLKALPGIGEYSAGAIASIAYGEVVPAVDGNVRRVLSRLLDLEDPTDANLRKLAGELVDPDRPGDWNQALMELGATVCVPRAPRCTVCPLNGDCRALAEGTQELRPASKRRPRVRRVSYAVVVALNSAGELFMVRRPSDGLLGGLWEFPAIEIGVKDVAPVGGELSVGSSLHERCLSCLEDQGVHLTARTVRFKALPEVRHAFTHLKAVYRPMLVVELGSWGAEGAGAIAMGGRISKSDERRWVLSDQVGHLPLPVAQRRILDNFRTAMANAGRGDTPTAGPDNEEKKSLNSPGSSR
jgi:A/G-specific adenine glycosylase